MRRATYHPHLAQSTLLRVVHIGARGNCLTEVIVRPGKIGRQPCKIFAKCAGHAGEFQGAFAVSEQQRAVAIANMNLPNAVHRIEPTALLVIEIEREQLAGWRLNGGCKRGVFAKNKS